MKRVALRGSWDTPPTPVRKWELTDANTFIQRLSLDAPSISLKGSLTLETDFGEWETKDTAIPVAKEISPAHTKAVGHKVATAFGAKPLSRRKVGFALCGNCDDHADPHKRSPEHCSRIAAIVRALEERKELASFLVNLSQTPRLATDAELLTVHTKGYLNKLQRLISNTTPQVSSKEHNKEVNDKAADEFDSIYMTAKSAEAARLSAGSAIQCVETVCRGELTVAAAAIRPPGHHAEAHCAMGFCFFNNAALATKRALDLGMKRVLIVDQDIHHGNGTQRAFWDYERVLYFSVHRWDNGRFYPHNDVESAPSCVGPKDTPAAGKTVNVAFCDGEMGDLEYRAVWESVLLPIANEFNPDMIIFSAGFDAAEGDPIGRYHVSPSCFGSMVSSLLTRCPTSKAVLLLEGGYNTAVTAEAFCECIRALTFSSDPSKSGKIPCEWPDNSQWTSVKDQAIAAINKTIEYQSPYWSSLLPVSRSNIDGGRTLVPR